MGLFVNTTNVKAKQKAEKYRNLIRKEAQIGGTLFGPVPVNTRREFFCLDEHTWVWHEEWVSRDNKKHIQTTRYDVRKDCVVKCQNNGPYTKVSPAEADNLLQAAKKYQANVKRELYALAA